MLMVTAREMAQLDRETIEGTGIPGIVLMENAARGAATFYQRVMPDLGKGPIAVVAGSGNNAGDGFVLARLFSERGATVRVLCLKSPDRLKGDALTNFRILEKLGVPITVWDEGGSFEDQFRLIEASQVIIDAILGTGLNSEVRGLYRQIIDRINDAAVPVLAVDIPSGLDASTGKPQGTALKAFATATFGLPKIGQMIPPGEQYVGILEVIDIGIPHAVVEGAGIHRWYLEESLMSRFLAPRPAETHKGHAGHVAILAGSVGKTGAAALASLGAARVGAGLVTHCVPAGLNPIMEVKLTEAMTFPIAETIGQSASAKALPELLHFLQDKSVLALGPGLSLEAETEELTLGLISRAPCPLVLDADALTLVSRHLDVLAESKVPAIVTPHPGEMARLTGLGTKEIQADRLRIAAEFSRRYDVIVVLKGHRTVIAAPDGRLAVNGSGNPAMACGGMGDVLTGMVAGWLAQGLEPFISACLGVYVHGAAADDCVLGRASRGLLATDLLQRIPDVIGRLEKDL